MEATTDSILWCWIQVRADRSCITDIRTMQLLTVERLNEDDVRRREAEEIRVIILEAKVRPHAPPPLHSSIAGPLHGTACSVAGVLRPTPATTRLSQSVRDSILSCKGSSRAENHTLWGSSAASGLILRVRPRLGDVRCRQRRDDHSAEAAAKTACSSDTCQWLSLAQEL